MTRPGVSVPPPVSAAQRSVLYAVRRRGEATVTDIAEMLDMTPSGARQHLTGLADVGLLQAGEASRVPGQQGRSERTYCIAPAAESLFPRAYGELTNQLLGYVPAGAVTAAFEHRRDDRIAGAAARLARKRTFPAKVTELAKILDEDGYLVGRVDRRRRLPHRRAQLCHLRRRPRAPAGVLDRARVPARRAARGRHRAGDAHDGRGPQLQLRDPPARSPELNSRQARVQRLRIVSCRRAGSWGPRW